jgi:hypothetical protein
MLKAIFAIIALVLGLTAGAQNNTTDYNAYGAYIFEMVLSGNQQLKNEFIDLVAYTSYVDQLQNLPEYIREEIKYDATRDYHDVRLDYEQECSRILALYQQSKDAGTSFSFDMCAFAPNKNFPDIGIITCFYTVNLPDEEEPEGDALRFECIYTPNGWRILDGFFDAINP